MQEAMVPIHVEALPEGGFLATSDELPGLVAQGRTVSETLEIAPRTWRASSWNPIASTATHCPPHSPKGYRRLGKAHSRRSDLMGRLAAFSADEVIRKRRRSGFVFDRQANGSREIWWHPGTRARTTVPNHPGDLPEGTVAAILKQAGSPSISF